MRWVNKGGKMPCKKDSCEGLVKRTINRKRTYFEGRVTQPREDPLYFGKHPGDSGGRGEKGKKTARKKVA